MCASPCVSVHRTGKRDNPWGEQKDGIMHVLNIITMQNVDAILEGVQVLMGLGNGISA